MSGRESAGTYMSWTPAVLAAVKPAMYVANKDDRLAEAQRLLATSSDPEVKKTAALLRTPNQLASAENKYTAKDRVKAGKKIQSEISGRNLIRSLPSPTSRSRASSTASEAEAVLVAARRERRRIARRTD